MPASKPDTRTRKQVLDLLKQHGPQDAAALAERLAVSSMAVRQHLYQLQDEKFVTFDEQLRPKGRPAKLWRLTNAARKFFPDAHAGLAVDLIASMSQVFGSSGMEKLIASRARKQIADYRERLPKRASLKRRLEKLVAFRSEEGYMAELLRDSDDAFLLVENHCPICTAAAVCNGLCSAELDVFQAVLGDDVTVERTEHILNGARRCAYRVTKRGRSAKFISHE